MRPRSAAGPRGVALRPGGLSCEEERHVWYHVGGRMLSQHDVEVLDAEEEPAEDVHVDAVEGPAPEREQQGVEMHQELGHGGGRSPIVPTFDLFELVEEHVDSVVTD